MAIENGAQVLPTDGFEGFKDNEADTVDQFAKEFDEQEQQFTDTGDEGLVYEEPDTESSQEASQEDTQETDAEVQEATAETTEGTGEASTDSTQASDQQVEAQEQTQPQEISKKDDFKTYSRNVQRRINKEVKQREQLRADNEELRQRIAQLEQSMTSNQQDQEDRQLAQGIQTINNRLQNAAAIKKQLLDEGDYEEVTRVDDDIMQMRIQHDKLVEYAKNKRARQQQAQQQASQQQYGYNQGQQPAPQQQYQQQQEVQVPDIQKNWINNNERFGKDQAYTQYVNNVYDQLVDEGWDPEDPTTYDELNERTGSTVSYGANPQPQQQVAQQSAPKQQQAKPRAPAAPAPNSGRSQQRTASNNKNQLSEVDKRNMRNWGLDPNDENVRKEWLQNKLAS